MAIIKPNNNTISAITALPAAITTGKVLQSVFSKTTTVVNVTATTWTDVLSLNITPSSTSSKILVLASCGGLKRYGGDTELQLRVTRDGSSIAQIKGMNDGTSDFLSADGTPINQLDTPSSTSALTYKIQMNNRDATGTCQICGNNADTSLNLLEIAG